jgi:hypothetical protein
MQSIHPQAKAAMKRLQTQMEKIVSEWMLLLEDNVEFTYLSALDENPHKALIFPSDCIGEYEHVSPSFQYLASLERQLRVGNAFDAIIELQDRLVMKAFYVRETYDVSMERGNRATAQRRERIQNEEWHIQKWIHVYRENWKRINILHNLCRDDHDAPEHLSRLEELHDGDVAMLSNWIEEERMLFNVGGNFASKNPQRQDLKKKNTTLPWFWKISLGDNNGDSGISDTFKEKSDEGVYHSQWLYLCSNLTYKQFE